MKLLATLTAVCLACAATSSYASVDPTEKDAVAMVEKGAALVKAQGKEEIIKRIAAKDP